MDDFSHGLLWVSERQHVEKHQRVTFTWYHVKLISESVGGMQRMELFGSHRLDLEALNHPVCKKIKIKKE